MDNPYPIQDIIIGFCQWAFAAALFPSILSSDKPNRITCGSTAALLLIMGTALLSMSLITSAASMYLVAFLWSVLFFQKRT